MSTWARGPVEADPPLWLCSQHWPLIQEAGAALSAPRGREGALKISAEIRLAAGQLSLLGIFLQHRLPRPLLLPSSLTNVPAADCVRFLSAMAWSVGMMGGILKLGKVFAAP